MMSFGSIMFLALFQPLISMLIVNIHLWMILSIFGSELWRIER